MHDQNWGPRIIIGGFIVLIGLSLFLNEIGVNTFGFNPLSWWPLLLVILGLWMFTRRKMIGGAFFILLGIMFLAGSVFSFNAFAVIWPLIIIFVGVSILFRPDKHGNWHDSGDMNQVHKDRLDESIVFWAQNEKVISDNFKGGKLDCVFGGFKLDLSEVKLAKDGASLEVSGVFGGGEIILPKGVKVEMENASIMGGITNRVTDKGGTDSPVLKIKATAVFGGLELKN